MFTALVAAALLAAGIVLVNTLITTEDRMSAQLYSMFSNYQLSDAANLARADALQTFNYTFRQELETWLTYDSDELDEEGGISVITTKNYDDWESIKNNFECVILLTCNTSTDAAAGGKFKSAIKYISDKTIDNFKSRSYGRYNIDLSGRSSKEKEAMRMALSQALEKEDEKFLEVVGCEGRENCDVGTFYFNIPLDKISDEYYEALPRIIVKDLISGEELKIAILPKTKLKVYIPLRFFRALSEATYQAEAMDNAHNDVEELRLGFCDSCGPRTSPTRGDRAGSWDHQCPSNDTGNTGVTLDPKPDALGISTYNPGGSLAGKTALNAYLRDTICEEASRIESSSDTFQIRSRSNTDGLIALERGTYDDIVTLNGCPFFDMSAPTVGVRNRLIHGGVTSGAAYLYCQQITGVDADVVYKDTDPLYLVNTKESTGNYYKIRITDSDFTKDADGSGECSSSASGTGSCSPSS